MFHETSSKLANWINHVAGATVAAHGHTPVEGAETRVGLSLLDVRPHAARPGAKVEVTIRYLVTVSAASPVDAHRLLGELTFAAMTHREFVVDREPLPIEFWIASDMAPRPALVVQAPVSRDRRDLDSHAEPRLLHRDVREYASAREVERRSPDARTTPMFGRRASDLRHAADRGRAHG